MHYIIYFIFADTTKNSLSGIILYYNDGQFFNLILKNLENFSQIF